MSLYNLAALSPLLLIAVTAIIVMLIVAARRNHRLTVIGTLVGLTAALIALAVAASVAPRQITPLLRIDQYAVFYIGLMLFATVILVLFSARYQEKRNIIREEYYILLLLATFGAAVLVSSTHFASFFLGLELLSVSLYTLVAYQRDMPGIEGGMKYLIMAGVSSAFLLFGMALIYTEQGTMEFPRLATSTQLGALAAVGLAMILVGIGFKLALAPFHFWAPDVYEGAPVPTAAFLATVSKGAIFALLLRYFSLAGFRDGSALTSVFFLLAVVSMFTGNLLALRQRNLKRLLAYSSIAHMGYVLVAFLAGGAGAATVVTFYLVAYFITTLGAFGVIAELSGADHDAESLDEYRGLAWRRPWLAATFSAMLFSLAGIPLTAGFIGKFLLLTAGVSANRWALVIILILNSAIGLYYYLRVIMALYRQPGRVEERTLTGTDTLPYPKVSLLGSGALSVLLLLLIWFGVYPAPVLRVIQGAVSQLFGTPR